MTPSNERSSNNSTDPVPKNAEEIIACFSPKDIPKFHTGRLNKFLFGYPRHQAHQEGKPVLICRIYAWNVEGQFLIQKRSPRYTTKEGLFADSAAGHIRYTPEIDFEFIQEEAWRELHEEMGVHPLWGKFYDFHIEQKKQGRILGVYTFIALVGNHLTFDLEEVDPQSQFVPASEIQRFLEKKSFVPDCKWYWSKMISERVFQGLRQEWDHVNFNHPPGFQKTSSDMDPSQQLETKLNKNKGIGLIIGRFQPFHTGHLQFILAAKEYVATLKIGIGSSQYHSTRENPFTWEERKQMIFNSLLEAQVDPETFQIYPIPDLHNAELWSQKVLDVVGDFDLFFSNSQWTRQLFRNLGKPLGPVIKFNFSEFNGSQIRKRLFRQESIQELVPPAVLEILATINVTERLQSESKKLHFHPSYNHSRR